MIKKVGNWVFGSFFRTMGRFFFFLFFGFMLAMIISKNNISIKWTDLLGIETVKADTLTNTIWQTYYYDNQHSMGLMPTTSGNYEYEVMSSTNENIVGQYIYLGRDIVKTDFDYVLIPFTLTGITEYQENLPIDSVQQCITSYTLDSQNNYLYTSFRCATYGGETYSKQIKVAISLHEKNGDNDSQCIIENGFLKCSVLPNVTYGRLYISYYVPDELNAKVRFNFGKAIQFFKDIFNTIAENQETQIQQQNSTTSYITDSNTTEANTQANSFFSNFTSQDNGGISSIITAPLQAISGLVSATCQQIVLPIPYLDNKELVLPCMSAIYTEHFGAFFTIYQTIIFGAIAYRMLVSIFMMIQGFKNPDDDKIEVVDL